MTEETPEVEHSACDDCGRMRTELHAVPGGRSWRSREVCIVCLHDNYRTCPGCDEYAPLREGVFYAVNIDFGSTTDRYCLSCIEGERGNVAISTCDHCAELTIDEEPCHDRYTDDEGACSCSDCRADSRSRFVHDYSYKPTPEFHRAADELIVTRMNRYNEPYDASLYFGMELEVEAPRSDAAEEVSTVLGDVVYLKEDSSIDNGFEIVTHPMSFRYAMEKFNWDGIRALRSSGYIGTSSSCGLHIHVSKNGFTAPTHEYRWLMFWHRNQVVLKVLAGRDSTYGSYDNDQRRKLVDVVKKGDHSYRRSAINTQNDYTHEVRVFASTVYVNRIKAAIQLVEGTIEYTRTLRSAKVMKDGGYSWLSFLTFLRSDEPKYRQLIKRITDLGIDGEPQRRATSQEVWVEAEQCYVTHTRVTQEGIKA